MDAGRIVGPNDNYAAVTVRSRIGVDRGVSTHVRAERILNFGVPALVVAAHEDGAAARTAGRIHDAVVHEPDVVTEQLHAAAAAFAAFGFHRTRDERGVPGLYRDFATVDAVGANGPACAYRRIL